MILSPGRRKTVFAPVVPPAVWLLASLVAQPASAHTGIHSHHHTTHHSSPAAKPAPSASQAVLEAARNREAELRRLRAAETAKLSQAREDNAAAAERAKKDADHAATLSAATVTAAGQLQTTENRLETLEEQTADLRRRQEELKKSLDADAKALMPVLPVAQRLSLYPVDTLLTADASPDQSVTGLLIVRGLASSLETHAEQLKQHRQELEVLNTRLTERLTETDAVRRRQQEQQKLLSAQARAARDAQLRSNAAARQSAAHVTEENVRTASLQAEIDRIVSTEAAAMEQMRREAEAAERARKAAEEARRREELRLAQQRKSHRSSSVVHEAVPPSRPLQRGGGSLVSGRLLSAWGERTEAGPATGNTYLTAPGAGVRAPCSGTVEFAAPFRSYGQMLILNCGGGYRFVVAGFGSLDVATGQRLARGAAIGSMPGGSSPALMVQLRHGERSVNPASML